VIFTASQPFSLSITDRKNLGSKIKVPAALGLAVVDADAIDIIFKTGKLWYRV